MDKLKIVCAVFFVAALALLGVYMVRDNAGKDRAEPVIKVDGDRIEVSVKDGEEALMQGVTAEDAEDGDLTDKVIVESIGRFGADGCRIVTYAVIDSDSLVGHATRKLAYTDYTPTRFSMDKPLSFEMGTTNLTSRIFAFDSLQYFRKVSKRIFRIKHWKALHFSRIRNTGRTEIAIIDIPATFHIRRETAVHCRRMKKLVHVSDLWAHSWRSLVF